MNFNHKKSILKLECFIKFAMNVVILFQKLSTYLPSLFPQPA